VKPRVYLETSVVSYLVGRLSRDVVVLGNQELTREWWENRRAEYDLFISEVVIGEATIGDAELARQRMAICEALPVLALTNEAERLAPLLLKAAAMAPNAETDALHMAVAAVQGMDYLLSELHPHRQRDDSSRDRQAVQSVGIRAAGDLHTAGTDSTVTTMWEDPIVKETRAAREELFARFNHGLAALCEYLREKEREHSGRVVTLEPRRPEAAEIPKK